ncbi:MAG: hypothetical protein HOI66_09720, partial [Verrucomicrobia bacterium]|nr:hypothetical protein [Verrucomicrobiota bacterium]
MISWTGDDLDLLFSTLRHVCLMGLVRILVDGYSVLHQCLDIAPEEPRHSAAARDALVKRLTQYRDAIGTAVTIVFDGTNAPKGCPESISTPEMEVLYSPRGKTADDVIERVTFRMLDYGDVRVVTDDHAEQNTVIALGATASSTGAFMREVSSILDSFQEDLKRVNRRER